MCRLYAFYVLLIKIGHYFFERDIGSLSKCLLEPEDLVAEFELRVVFPEEAAKVLHEVHLEVLSSAQIVVEVAAFNVVELDLHTVDLEHVQLARSDCRREGHVGRERYGNGFDDASELEFLHVRGYVVEAR